VARRPDLPVRADRLRAHASTPFRHRTVARAALPAATTYGSVALMRFRLVAFGTALAAAAACGPHASDGSGTAGGTPPAATRSPRDVGGTPLPLGKADVPLRAGRWRSPETFAPPVSVAVTGTGWHSTHRFADMFDVGRPEPAADVPRLDVAFSLAAGPRAADVVRDVRTRMGAAATAPVADRIGALPATRFDVVGGTGEAYRSASGGFGMYGEPGQRLRFWVADADGLVLVAVAVVPDERKHWAAELPRGGAGGAAPPPG
jgi:hypothetical protein